MSASDQAREGDFVEVVGGLWIGAKGRVREIKEAEAIALIKVAGGSTEWYKLEHLRTLPKRGPAR